MNRLQDADAVRQVTTVFLQHGLQGGGRQFILIVVIGRARAARAEVFMKVPDAGVFLPHFKSGEIKAQPSLVVELLDVSDTRYSATVPRPSTPPAIH